MATGTSVGSLFWSTGVDFSGFKRDAKQGQSALSGLFNPALLGSAALGAAFVKLGSEALDFARQYETAFAEVQTISQSARENADEMRKSILKMTTEIPVGAIDSTKALYQIVSAGFDGAEAMNVLEISAKAAVAGVTTTAIAADTLTTIINAYGLSADDATTISDQLFKTVELGKTTLAEIGASFSQVASIAAAYGVNVNEALAATAAMTKQGAPTAQAMTSIKAAIVSVTEKLGENVFQTHSFGEALQMARDAADKSGEGLQKYFGRLEAVNGVLMLTNQNADVYADSLEKINDSAGSADAALKIMNGTFDSQSTLLQNNFNVALNSTGNVIKNILLPVIEQLNAEMKVGLDDTIPFYAKALSVLLNTASLGFGTFTAEQFAPDIVKSLLKSEKAVEEFTNKTKSLSNEAFQNEIENTRRQQAENIKLFENLQDRKEKGFQFDANALEEAKDRNLIYYQILESAEERLAKIKEKSITKPKKDGDTVEVPVKITIASLKAELKALNAEIETASKSEAVEIEVKIRAKKEELVKFVTDINDQIRGIQAKQEGVISLGSANTSEGISLSKKQTKEYEDQNKELAKMGGEWLKMQKYLNKYNGISTESTDNSEKLTNTLFDASDVMGEMASVAGNFDDELAKGLDIASGLAAGVGNMVAGLAAGGNPVQAIAGGLQIVGTLLSGGGAKAYNLAQEAESLASEIERQNRLLERQIELLDTLEGVDRSTGEKAVLSEIQKQIDGIDELARKEDLRFKKSKKSGLFGLNKSTTKITEETEGIEDLIEKYIGLGDASALTASLLEQGFKITNEDEIADLIDRYNELLATRTELLEDLTQTSSEDIADVLRDGFADGKDSIVDFADDFETLMKNALLESFKTKYLLAASEGFFQEFGDLAQDGITTSEIETLRGSFSDLIDNASTEFDALNKVFEGAFGSDITDSAESATGAAGSISAALTEDTATELQGIWNRSLFETISHTAILTESNGYLSEIAVNTLRTANACESLDSKLNSDSSSRDTGNIL